MIRKHSTFAAIAALSLGLAHCGSGSTDADEATGSATLELTQAPADAACLELTVDGAKRDVAQKIDLAPGEGTSYRLDRLPVGPATFKAKAYASRCSAVSVQSVPTWLSEPTSATISVIDVVHVLLKMIRNGRATVGIDFDDANGPASGGAPSATKLEFQAIPAALTDEERRFPQSSRLANVDGQNVEIGYNVIARTGQKIGSGVFGKLTNFDGTDYLGDDGQPVISPSADFSSFLSVGSKLFTVTHIETYPSAYYITELSQDAAGKLTAVATRPIDASPVDGLVFTCAGSVTPWNTHLGSEETDPDARTSFAATTPTAYLNASGLSNLAKYKKLDLANLAELRTKVSPYMYGWPVEVTVNSTGGTTIKKQYGMARMGLELAYVMPDQKTVYMSDDASNTTLYMFVATTAGDLGNGTLFAAKASQTDASNGGSFDLSWVKIGGEISSATVKAAIGTVTFTDLFDYAAPASGACADNSFKLVNTEFGPECLKVKPGQEALASRLETRRMAALLGATTEFSRFEGLTFSAERMELYTPLTTISRGMKDNDSSFDVGTRNEIRVAENICGGVYRAPLGSDTTIGSDYVAKKLIGFVVGTPKSYAGTPYEAANNRCDLEGLASPDNVTYIAGYRTLIIGEDTNNHQNDVLWSYSFDTGQMTRIFSTPLGAETTGPYWRPNVGNFSYLIANIQHPFGESDQSQLQNPDERQAYHGYIGPFPKVR
ncbi:MAG TPA: alkaline phosphatase PhoX [Polyangiaceae bacterium]|nr:alkaline phosphatase PhoX [Polyangiaceae bacterium]